MVGKKINQLTQISVLSDESVLPIVYVENGTADSTATKVTIEQLKEEIGVDAYTKQEADAKLGQKQNKLTAGENIVITEDSDETVISAITSSEYTAGIGINIESDEISIDDTVYTKENLVGGKDISITERQISGGDDEHTYLLMHFNDTFENNGTHNTSAISVDSSMGLPNSVTYSAGKFGKCAAATTYPSGVMWPWTKFNNSAVSSVKDYFTIDCWVYYNQTAVATFENTKGTRFVPFNVVASDGQFNMQLGSADAYVAYGSSQTSASEIYSALVNNSWNHLAITFSNGGDTKFYINGSLIKTYSGVTLANGVNGVEVRQVPEGCGIDELRLSNVIRWDSEFDLPTKPYNASVTVLNEINNTKLIVACTQAEYEALVSGGTVDANTLYVIISGS